MAPEIEPGTSDPAIVRELRRLLERARERGEPFDRAWAAAESRLPWPRSNVEREQWRRVLRATRDEWRAAYYGEKACEIADAVGRLDGAVSEWAGPPATQLLA